MKCWKIVISESGVTEKVSIIFPLPKKIKREVIFKTILCASVIAKPNID